MKVDLLLDEIEQSIQNRTTRSVAIDRDDLLQMVERSLSDLAVEGEWDWDKIWLAPMIQTATGNRHYPLPEHFPENFTRGGQDTGQEFMCKLSDGTNESFLIHKSPEQYFTQNITGGNNGTPAFYTVRRDAGTPLLSIFPPPDNNGGSHYTILGLYTPSYWKLESQDDPLPGGASLRPFLREAVLQKWYLGRNAVQYAEHKRSTSDQLGLLRYRQAKSKRIRMIPRLSETGTHNDYSQMQRR